MYIKSVSYKNFRNYEDLKLDLSTGINIFKGENAQGKTNFVEGIYMAAMGKSFKYVQDKELVHFEKERAEINIDFFGYNVNNNININVDKKKEVRVNGLKIERRADLIGNLNVVLFTPAELNIVREGPFFRRRYLDICAGALRHKYLYALTAYNHVLMQKNKLLKENSADGTIDIWNEKLAEYGSSVMWYRASLTERIKKMIAPLYEKISDKNERLSMCYVSALNKIKEMSMEEIRQAYFELLLSKKEDEKLKGSCEYGPHRDDIIFFINGKKAKNFGSQGQQRSIVLALKLVQTELYFEETGEYPVLLLDDITSELDSGRRSFLYNEIKNTQVILTCTDAENIFFNENACCFSVSSGVIKKL